MRVFKWLVLFVFLIVIVIVVVGYLYLYIFFIGLERIEVKFFFIGKDSFVINVY